MKLPSDSDYQAALQNPQQAFSDPELREGQLELGTGAMAGLPRPRAGNFATVYKVECGSRAYAVRCFTRAVQPDQQVRYLEITRHLSIHQLPCAVDVSFLSQGILVNGQWFPIVKMEWVQGESLSRYVEKHRESPKALFELATAWVELLADLRRAGVAHGDLQHGNVVVAPAGLRLVDYDGMFVPALAGRRSHERGHANYQHPLRDADFFDARLDHFSAWVVWLSLVALAHEPGLWERFHGGDDCLLFRKQDFAQGTRSPVLQALLESRHERVRGLAGFFQSLLSRPPADVPALDVVALSAITLPEDFVSRLRQGAAGTGLALRLPVAEAKRESTGPGASSGVAIVRRKPSSDSRGRELAALLAVSEPSSSPTATRPSSSFDAHAVRRFIVPASGSPVVSFSPTVSERQVAGGILVAAVLSLVLSVVLAPAWLMGLAIAGGLGFRWASASYWRQAPVQRQRQCQEQLARTQRALEEEEARLHGLLKERVQREQEVLAWYGELRDAQAVPDGRVSQALRHVREVKRKDFEQFEVRRRELDQQEHDAREALEVEKQTQLAELSARVEALSSVEKAKAEALQQLQEKHVADVLQGALIEKANIRGFDLSPKVRRSLEKAGVRTAADVTRARLRTVWKMSAGQQDLLLEWRGQLIQQARWRMPHTLPEDEARFITMSWAEQQRLREEGLSKAREAFARRATELTSRFAAEREALRADEDALTEQLWRAAPRLGGRFGRASQELESRSQELAALDARIAAARRACVDLRWSWEETATGLVSQDSLRFGRYLTLLFSDGQEQAPS
ncbi:hypothetical protein ACLESO_12965 [Pyxidicoccus sp. 3LG]